MYVNIVRIIATYNGYVLNETDGILRFVITKDDDPTVGFYLGAKRIKSSRSLWTILTYWIWKIRCKDHNNYTKTAFRKSYYRYIYKIIGKR